MSGTITKPPPYDSAPTLKATHASAPRPPIVAVWTNATGSQAVADRGADGRCSWMRTATSMSPQPSSTRTRNGPIVAAAAALTPGVDKPSAPLWLARTHTPPARRRQPPRGVQGHRRHGGAGTGGRAEGPQ